MRAALFRARDIGKVRPVPRGGRGGSEVSEWESRWEPECGAILSEEPGSPEELEAWVLRWDLLQRRALEEANRRWVAMMRDVHDERAAASYREFADDVWARMLAVRRAVARKLLQNPHAGALPPVYGRFLKIAADIYTTSPDGIEDLFRSIDAPVQEYGREVGRARVRFGGGEYSVQEAHRFLESPDREVRKAAYEAIGSTALDLADRLDGLFSRLMELRARLAEAAGFERFTDYVFTEMHRDYDPEWCARMHGAVLSEVAPALSAVLEERRRRLGVDVLRPWDLRVPVHEWSWPRDGDLLGSAEAVLEKVGPPFDSTVPELVARGGIDVEARPGKANIRGYFLPFDLSGEAFVLVHPWGTRDDLRVLLHELGHATHYRLCRRQPLVEYRTSPPYEVLELFSTLTEWLGVWGLGPGYLEYVTERSLTLIAESVAGDMFQMGVYASPGMDAEDRRRLWLSVLRRALPGVEFDGVEEAASAMWVLKGHFFETPLYYVEYAIATLGAMEVYVECAMIPEGMLRRIAAAMELGLSAPAPAVYGVAGATWGIWESDSGRLRRVLGQILDDARAGGERTRHA